jgi:hypothetical protein
MVMPSRTRSSQKILDSAITLMMLLRLLLDGLLQLFQSCRIGERRESEMIFIYYIFEIGSTCLFTYRDV